MTPLFSTPQRLLEALGPLSRLRLTATEKLFESRWRHAPCILCIGVRRGIAVLLEAP